ncbi:MAG: phosphotransferase family protein [Dehalococcoidia bacterium]|nr:phosphotransferase family protein [Dehalococcoidia bacterium]
MATAYAAAGEAVSEGTTEARLAAFITAQTGGPAEVHDLQRIPGGFSYETWRLKARWQEAGEPRAAALIMRKAPRGGVLDPYDASVEFRVLAGVAGSGVPVPRVYWCDPSGDVLGTSFYVMEYVAGDVPLPWDNSLPEDERLSAHEQFTDALAALHGMDWEGRGLGFLGVPKERTDPAALALDRCEELLERVRMRPYPVIREALAYLRSERPSCPRLSLVHDDYRMGNFVWRDGKIQAILDWERAFIGDPMADIAFSRMPLGGWCTIDGAMAERYTARSGIVVDDARVRYWQVLELLKANLVAPTALRAFADGRTSDLRLVQIGLGALASPAGIAEAIGLGR